MQLTKKDAGVFKVKTKQGFEIRATEWHKFYVKRNNEIQKLQLNQLVPGDKLLIQSVKGHMGIFMNLISHISWGL
ncbi:Hint domain-containing protein [Bacillus licheniformis]|uniref:Hint domain-containing protein n=1 Tax=Bacillus licheniformis TaxID=1402 RepID=UPI0022783EE3|nr:Hint domain-containing protein [Bacillus licheniformis]